MPKTCISFIFFLLICLPLSAQEPQPSPKGEGSPLAQSEDFWISPGAIVALYSPVNLSYGGGLTVAYGSGTSVGVKAAWLFDNEGQLNILLLDILFRWYFFGASANSGLFLQFAGGPAIFFEHEEKVFLPVRIGTLSAGLTLGWRFLLGKYFYLEPSISGGYPYIAGAGLSAGIRF